MLKNKTNFIADFARCNYPYREVGYLDKIFDTTPRNSVDCIDDWTRWLFLTMTYSTIIDFRTGVISFEIYYDAPSSKYTSPTPCGSVRLRGWVEKNAFFFNTGIITDTGTCIIHQNEAGLLWIPFIRLNIVTVSLSSNVPPSNKSMYLCLVKFCWLFFLVDF